MERLINRFEPSFSNDILADSQLFRDNMHILHEFQLLELSENSLELFDHPGKEQSGLFLESTV
jgi:hypothetical protein